MITARRLAFALPLLLIGCSNPSIDTQLAELETEREAFLERVEQIPDKALRTDMAQMARMLFWMRNIGLEQQRKPETTVYAERPLGIVDDYDSLDAMARNYADGLLATNELKYFPANTELVHPFEYPFAHTLAWQQVTLTDGTALPVIGENEAADHALDEAGPSAVYATSFNRLKTLMRGDGDPPAMQKLDGTLTLTVPDALQKATFKAGEAGQTRNLGGFAVTLEAVDGHQARVSIRPDSADAKQRAKALGKDLDEIVTLVARDETGRTLDDRGRSTGPPGFEDILLDTLDDVVTAANEGRDLDEESVQDEIEKRQKELIAENDGATYVSTAFRGTVDAIDVLLVGAGAIETRTVRISLKPKQFSVPDNAPALVAFPTEATVYDHSLDDLDDDRPADLSEAELATAISVSQTGYSEVADYEDEPAIVRFEYPDVSSNRYTSVFTRYDQALEITFLDDAGQPIALPENADVRNDLYDFTVNRIEYHPARFPTPPARVKGELLVVVRPNVERRWIDASNLPEGTELTGNAFFTAPAYDNNQPTVHAQDASGRFLKQMASIRYGYDDEPPRRAYYYFGKPTRVLLIDPGVAERAGYAFDIELAD